MLNPGPDLAYKLKRVDFPVLSEALGSMSRRPTENTGHRSGYRIAPGRTGQAGEGFKFFLKAIS